MAGFKYLPTIKRPTANKAVGRYFNFQLNNLLLYKLNGTCFITTGYLQ